MLPSLNLIYLLYQMHFSGLGYPLLCKLCLTL
nr:MAG TPA: U6 snRNA-associated Sm-like protein [Caudoviricetes sp.]